MPKAYIDAATECIRAARKLSQEAELLDFSASVPWVYNPLDYAWAAHEQYLTMAARSSCHVIFLGMNPGPWGMAQTGVPFGELDAVRDWMGVDAPISKPKHEHPKRPIEGWDCKRSEVSGRRLWGLFAQRFESANHFFDEHFVANYCPLVFMEESARNVTPDKLPAAAREPLEAVCDTHLAALIQSLEPKWVIGVGAWAEGLAKRVTAQHQISDVQIGRILHPSPASPAANKDWAGTALKQLLAMKVWLE